MHNSGDKRSSPEIKFGKLVEIEFSGEFDVNDKLKWRSKESTGKTSKI